MKQYICPVIEAVELIGEHLMEASAPFVEFGDGGAIPSGDIINQGR